MIKSITKEEFKAEAIRRMEELHFDPFIIHDFKKDGTLYCSEIQPPIGIMSNLSSELKDKVKWVEERSRGMVYHIIKTEAILCGTPVEMYSFLYISPYREDWEVDKRIIQDNLVFSYVWNKTWDDCSEFGSIQVANINGLLLRTA